MAKKNETIEFLNKELDIKAKELKLEKIPEQATFDQLKAGSVVLRSKTVKEKIIDTKKV